MRTRAVADRMSGGPVSSLPARADRLGVALSLGCAAHCVAAPLLAAGLPAAGIAWLLGRWVEALLVMASLVLAAGSLYWGVRVHRRRGMFLPLGAALALMIAGRLLADSPYERLLVVTGAILLSAGHLLNRHLCRTCAVCSDDGREESTGSRESTGWS